VRKDFVTANSLLPLIPKAEYGSVARFLESQGFKEEALAVTNDLDHKFELAIDLRRMEIAHKVLLERDSKLTQFAEESTESQSKWRRLGDLALLNGEIELAEHCASRSGDMSGLLLLYSCAGNKDGMLSLAERAKSCGRLNVSFVAYFLTGRIEEALGLLIDAGRIPEAAFMARTYLPSHIPRILKLWKEDLKTVNEKAAEALADPEKYPNLFPDLETALKVEQIYLSNRNTPVPAYSYPNAKGDLDLNLVELVKSSLLQSEQQIEIIPPAPVSTPISPLRTASQPVSIESAMASPKIAEVRPPPPGSPLKTESLPSPKKAVETPIIENISPVAAPRVEVAIDDDEEEDDFDALLKEENDLLNSSSYKSNTSSPTKSANPPLVEEEEEEDMNLDSIDKEELDLLENEEEEEDW